MTKRFAVEAVLLLGIVSLLSACASEDKAAESSPVPGEKISDEGRLAPGSGTSPNASVKW